MCGIIAISSPKYSSYQISNSLNAMHHRGPDDEGIYVSANADVHLGQVRLSIIDLTKAGHQPMTDSSGRFIITYNGEIYNFLDLKIYLEKKYRNLNWKSTSDTEVILEGFALEGESFLSKLNGIFAIAIYDIFESKLFVLRDPIGVKPLYVSTQNSSVYFASEVKGLLALNCLEVNLRKQSLVDQLAYMYVPEPFTMYNEILKVEPGVLFIYKNGFLLDSIPVFNHLNSNLDSSSEYDIIEKLHNELSEAVKRQLISDVPISLFLSGGLDSSSIAYESIVNNANIKSAYTISFSEKDNKIDKQSSDLKFANLMAKELGINLCVVEANSDFLNLLPSLIDFMEDGISDPAAINTYLICKAARKDGVKVMLSGQGADEYLGGYRRYKAENFIREMHPFVKSLFSSLNTFLPPKISGSFSTPYRRFKKILNASNESEHNRFINYFLWSNPDYINSLFIDKTLNKPGSDLLNFIKKNSDNDNFSTMLLADQKFDLRSLNLSYTDKMSMAVGLEVRVPFLDHEMVKLMNSIPRSLMLKNGHQKYILKKAMEPYLPKEVIYRNKAGFALPIRSWFSKNSSIIEHYLNYDRISRQGIFHPNMIRELLREQFSGKVDHSYLIFSLLCQQIWLEKQKFKNVV